MRSAPSSSAPRAPRPVAAMLAALLLLSAGAGTAGPVLPVLRRAERDRAPGTAPAARGRAAGRFDVLFLGSGVSTGVPRIGCIVRPDQSQPRCKVCHDALREGSRNRRGNVSILLRYWHADGRPRHIMVDAGKTMREQCMRLLPRHGIRTLDALLLTHAHADAIHGLDDIRDFQQQGTRHLSWLPPLPCYASAKTFEEIKRRFGYLVPGAGSELEKETAATTANATMVRTVSKLDWHVIPETLATDGASAAGSRAGMTAGNGPQGGGADSGSYAPFDVKGCDGLQVTALPVIHGGELVSLAFDFQTRGEWSVGGRGPLCHRRGPLIQEAPEPRARFTYISDVSRIPDSVMASLRSGPQVRVLVLDCLHYGKHFSHFGLSEAVAAARAVRPQQVLLVGMTCSIGDHAATNRRLRRLWTHPKPGLEPLDIQLAHDGLVLHLGQ